MDNSASRYAQRRYAATENKEVDRLLGGGHARKQFGRVAGIGLSAVAVCTVTFLIALRLLRGSPCAAVDCKAVQPMIVSVALPV